MDRNLATAWLALQCRMMPQVSRAFVGLNPSGAAGFASHAWWPENIATTAGLDGRIADAAQEALQREAAILREPPDVKRTAGDALFIVACPVLRDGEMLGVVAVAMQELATEHRDSVARLLGWGSAWLAALLHTARDGDPRTDALHRILGDTLRQAGVQAAATAAATGLAERLGCERVSVGLRRRGRLRMEAMSHTAVIDRRGSLPQGIEEAMRECMASDTALCHPTAEDIRPNHQRRLAERQGAGSVCSVPLPGSTGEPACGALTLEWRCEAAIDPQVMAFCQSAAALLGPVFALQSREGRWIGTKIASSAGAALARLFGAAHPDRPLTDRRLTGRHMAILVCGAFLLAAVFGQGQHRVSGGATLEGSLQRSIAAPIAGFIGSVHVRAGDSVAAGDLLATIDTTELALERRRWENERDDLRNQFRRAIARLERAQAKILEAQIGRAEAQVALIDEQLKQARILAPFAGLIVSGDLDRSVGAPVERGQALYELAPLDGYRVLLRIPERDIAHVLPGQPGQVVLQALPGDPLNLVVEKIVDAAEVEDGENGFRVLARLEAPATGLRPGMQGVAKVETGRRRLLWIWTHRLTERLALFFWTHAP